MLGVPGIKLRRTDTTLFFFSFFFFFFFLEPRRMLKRCSLTWQYFISLCPTSFSSWECIYLVRQAACHWKKVFQSSASATFCFFINFSFALAIRIYLMISGMEVRRSIRPFCWLRCIMNGISYAKGIIPLCEECPIRRYIHGQTVAPKLQTRKIMVIVHNR